MTKKQNNFLPDYLVAPGEILEEYLDNASMTQKELALRTDLTPKTINAIVKGKASITPETAIKLERVFGRPAHFWLNLEANYQIDKARLAAKNNQEPLLEWLAKIPIAFMKKHRWIAGSGSKLELAEQALTFFGVDSPESFYELWNSYHVAYRQTSNGSISEEAVFAWLRRGQLESQKISLARYDRERFQAVLMDIRPLVCEPSPQIFMPRLESLCAGAGVAVVFVPAPPKTCVCGSTRWLGDNPMIQLSLRYKTNDQLWFTFFHEAGHIVKHGRKDFFIEYDMKNESEKEREADVFASDLLIPPAKLRAFLSRAGRTTLDDIKQFASEIGIAPAVVIGRLQHDGKIPYSWGHKYKTRYEWSAP